MKLNKPTVLPNPANPCDFATAKGDTRVKGSRGIVSFEDTRDAEESAEEEEDVEDRDGAGVSMFPTRVANAELWIRAPEGSNDHSSHLSNVADVNPGCSARILRLTLPLFTADRGFRRTPTTRRLEISHPPLSQTVSATRTTQTGCHNEVEFGDCLIDMDSSGLRRSWSSLAVGRVNLSSERRPISFSDARRECTPCPEIGKGGGSKTEDSFARGMDGDPPGEGARLVVRERRPILSHDGTRRGGWTLQEQRRA